MGGEASTGRRSRPGGGRLELTWANKDRRLLAHDDVTYEWVDPQDWRVSEVRLLDVVDTYGEDAEDNLLIQGDALHALTALSSVPEYADRYLGRVKLAYLDPPFNTGQTFQQYDDNLEHSVWLTMLRDRLEQIHRLLRADGTVWVHLDDAEVHRARCVMDEVFGATNYLSTVVWRRTSAKSLARRTMGTLHEMILVYGASEEAGLKTLYQPLEPEYVKKRFTNADERGVYDTGDLTAGSYRPHLDSGKPWRGYDPSERRRCWAVSAAPLLEAGHTPADLERMSMREKLDALDNAGYVHWPERGGFPRFKKYLHNVKGRAVGDLWDDLNVINSQAQERSGFSTQKPEALLQRVIEMSSDTGDIVLDCFGGSGTTAAVAHKMGRRWITVELSADTVDTFIVPRLGKVVDGGGSGGVSEAVVWKGGGGFTEARVAPSMFEDVDGTVVLADWATNGQLAEAVAAQLKFGLDPEGPFVGRKGRTRLSVLDGMLTVGVADHLLDQLDERENLVVVAMTLEEGVAEHLRKQRPGSRARKVPRDLARSGKLAPRLVRLDRSEQEGDGQ